MYQLLAESFFGLKRYGNRLTIKPCVPDSWDSFDIHYKFAETTYHLKFERNASVNQVKLAMDGVDQDNSDLLLVNDGLMHEVKVSLPVQVQQIKTLVH